MDKVKTYIKHLFTEKGNDTYSMTKLVVFTGAVTMIIEFLKTQSQDYLGFGIGLSVLIAANAGKYFIEKSPLGDSNAADQKGN